MKLKSLVAFIILLNLSLQESIAQQRLLDSLLIALTEHPREDIKHLEILNSLSSVYSTIQLDSGIIAADKAIALSEKLSNKKELAIAFNNKAINLIRKGTISKAKEILQSALTINTALKDDNGIADTHVNLAYIKVVEGVGDSAKDDLNKAYSLYQKTGNKNGMANVNYWKGWILSSNVLDSTCITLFEKSIMLFEEMGNEAGVAFSNDALGSYYTDIKSYIKSIECYNKAIKISSQNNLSYLLAQHYADASNVYVEIADDPKALDYILKALRLSERNGSQAEEGYCLGMITRFYLNLNEYTKALEYSLKSIDIAERQGQIQFLPYLYNDIGTIYSKMNNPDKSFRYFDKAMEIALLNKNEMAQSPCLTLSGRAYLRYKQYDKAILNFQKAWVLDTKLYGKEAAVSDLYDLGNCIIEAPEVMLINAGINPSLRKAIAIDYFQQVIKSSSERGFKRDALFELSNVYEKEGNVKKSFNYYRQYILVKDSIMNTENSNSIANMQIQYETEKKEQEITLLSKDKALQQTEINTQKATGNSLIGGIILVLLITMVTYNRYRVKQKANNIITKTLLELKNTQQQLIEQEKLAALGKLTSDTAQEIEKPLNDLNDFSGLNNALLFKIKSEKNQVTMNNMLDHLKMNLQKINQYGKNADAVVKKVLMTARNVSK
jgi:tetratricopeptide (TPR) repeat protein